MESDALRIHHVCQLHIGTAEEGANVMLDSKDAFIQDLQPFELSARMRQSQPPESVEVFNLFDCKELL
jgi:hypothetical protein